MKTLYNLFILLFISVSMLAQTADTTLVAYFPFNGNAIDVTGNGHNGTVNGGVLTNDRFNQEEKAYTFPNLHNNIVLDNTTGLNLENGFTLNTWVKYKNINCGIVGKHNCWVVNGFYLGIDNGHFWLRLANSVWSDIVTNEVYVEDQWYMVTGVYDHATSTGKVYVNGVLKASGSVLYNNYSSAPITISEGSNGCPDGNMPGAIDEVKIYNRALSDAEILAEYNSSSTDLIAYFPFNGNAIDETGNGYDGTINGNTTLVPDRFGSQNKAFTFPDQLSSISLANSTNLNLENGFTINAWIKYTVNNYTTVIVCKHVCGFVNGFFFGIDADGQIQLWIGNSGWSTVRTNQSFVEGQWYMVTASYDATTSTAKVYVNGELGGSGSVVYNNFSSNPISIGETYLNNCGAGFMDGAVDEVKIYDRVLGDSEIMDEYNNTYNDLVLFLPFSGNANDESGNGNNGTVNGASLTQDRFGVSDRAYNFNGIMDFISIADNPNLFSDELTISWWYKITEILGGERVVIGWVDGGHRYQQFFNGGQLSYLNGYNVAQPGIYFNPIYGLNDLNVWKNVVVTYQKTGESTSTTSIYVDGELKQTDNHSLAMDYAPGPDFFIGKNHNGNFFKGYLDDLRIFNRILTSNEILDLYNDSTTYTPPNLEDGLVAFYPFHGNANDQSPTANNAIVIGATLTEDRFGVDNNAYYFNGTGRLQAADNTVYDFGTEDFSMNAWVNIETINTARIVSAGYNENDGIWGLGFGTQPIWGSGNRINFFVYSNNAFQDFSSDEITNYTTGNWALISVVKQSNSIKFFFNGQQVGTVPINFQANSNSYLSIGCRQQASNVFDEFLIGKIDDIRLYNRALSNEEVVLLYNDSTTYYPPLEDGLVAYWPMNGNTNDSTFNNNDGINYGGSYVKDRYGINDAAMFFDSLNSYIEGINPGNNLPVGNSPRSFSAWIKALSYDDYGNNIFHYGTAQPAPTNFHFLIKQSVALGNGYGYGVLYGNTNVVDSTWHFVTGVYEGGTERIAKLFVDGKLDATGNITSEPNTILGSNWRIGRFMEGEVRFNGNIDEVKVYEIPLTNQQIWDKYIATTTAPNLLFPGNDSTLINNLTPLMDWDSTITANAYRIIIANDSLFSAILIDTILNSSSFQVYEGLLIHIENLYWKVRTINDGGIGPWSEINRFQIVLTDVEDETQLPTEFALLQNYPNPFNPSTTITYHLPTASKVELKVYDIIGNEIATLVNEVQSAGRYNVDFGSHSDEGQNLSSGIYFYKFTAGDFVQTKKMILLK